MSELKTRGEEKRRPGGGFRSHSAKSQRIEQTDSLEELEQAQRTVPILISYHGQQGRREEATRKRFASVSAKSERIERAPRPQDSEQAQRTVPILISHHDQQGRREEVYQVEDSDRTAPSLRASSERTAWKSWSKRTPTPKATPTEPTRAHLKLIDAAVAIGQDRPSELDAVYMARELVQCTLPHRNPGNVPVWTRRNGNLNLIIQQGYDRTGTPYGHPYGTLPRLVLFWITTEAVRKQSPRLELGSSLASFMRGLGLDPSRGGVRSDSRRLREQMERLFRARISFERDITRSVRTKAGTIEQQHGTAWLDMQVAHCSELWWDMKSPEQIALWGSWIELGEKFFRAITAAPVPVDVRALKALKRSPLALDLYAWLTHESYRAHKSGTGRFVAWSCLMEQLGADYKEARNFQTKTRAALKKVELVYPALKLGSLRAGVQIDPQSFPAIQPNPRQSISLKPSRA